MPIAEIIFPVLFFLGLAFVILSLVSKRWQALIRGIPWLVPVATIIVGLTFGYAFSGGLGYDPHLWSLMIYFALLFTISLGSLLYLITYKRNFKTVPS